MKVEILCEKCKKRIGWIDNDSMVMDAEFGNIGMDVLCGKCKKETYEYKEKQDKNDLINEKYIR